jgi:hypothetical protein
VVLLCPVGSHLVMLAAAAVFYLASRKLKFLVKHAIPSGLLYGVVVYAFMNDIVLPLSAYRTKIALPHILDVAVLMFIVGLPIVLIARKYSH